MLEDRPINARGERPLQPSEHQLASYGGWWSYARRKRLTGPHTTSELALSSFLPPPTRAHRCQN